MKIESEKDIVLNHIKGNWRYKVFRYKDKTYILDGSTYWFSFLLNLTKWILLPINAYEIDDAVIEELKEKTSVKGIDLSWNIILIVMFLSGIIAKFVDNIASKLDLIEKFGHIYIYMIPTMFIVYFTISRYFKKKKILRLLNGEYNKKRIRFKLSSEKNILKDILWPLLLLIIFLVPGTISDIRNINSKKTDIRIYLTYFLAFFIWFVLVVSTTIGVKHLVGATVIIEDKERK